MYQNRVLYMLCVVFACVGHAQSRASILSKLPAALRAPVVNLSRELSTKVSRYQYYTVQYVAAFLSPDLFLQQLPVLIGIGSWSLHHSICLIQYNQWNVVNPLNQLSLWVHYGTSMAFNWCCDGSKLNTCTSLQVGYWLINQATSQFVVHEDNVRKASRLSWSWLSFPACVPDLFLIWTMITFPLNFLMMMIWFICKMTADDCLHSFYRPYKRPFPIRRWYLFVASSSR